MSSSSSIPCVVEKCELASLALCQCCKKDLCIDHLNEHANQRNSKLLPFIDKINVLLNRFSEFYDGNRSIRKQLDQWRDDAYKIIENFYQKKRQEFSDETKDQQREQLNEIHQKLKELIRKKGGTQQDFDTFSNDMNLIEQHLDKLQHIELNLPALIIDNHCIIQYSTTTTQTDIIEPIINKSLENSDNSSRKSIEKKKSSKKRKKSSRYSDDDSSDRSSHHRSRSPYRHNERSKKRREKSIDSNSSISSNHKKSNCDDCHDCRFYQDRFGPGFMDSFGPCSCECHKWAYSQMKN